MESKITSASYPLLTSESADKDANTQGVSQMKEPLISDKGKSAGEPVSKGSAEDDRKEPYLGDDKGNKHDECEDEKKLCFLKLTKKELGLLVLMSLVDFSIHAFLSLLGPFFAIQAKRKGVSATEVGFIFGIVPLVSLIASPIFGGYIHQIGVKFLLVSGIMSTGYCAFLFGLVDYVDNPVTYTVLCLVVRGVEGVGTAVACTAVFAILANTFPDRLATMSAFIEAAAGLGFILGAPIGGALYQAGGFLLPFVLCGALMVLIGVVLWVFGPSLQCENIRCESKWGLLGRAPVVMALINLIGGVAAIGFMLSRLGAFVSSTFKFSPIQVSIVYLCSSASYLLGTLIWGSLTEYKSNCSAIIYSAGYICTGVAFLFLGLTPFKTFSSEILLFFACTCLAAFGLSSGLIAFQIVGTVAKEFIGPVITGYMHDRIGFAWTCTLVGITILAMACAQLSIHLVCNICGSVKKCKNDEMVPLASLTSRDVVMYTEASPPKSALK